MWLPETVLAVLQRENGGHKEPSWVISFWFFSEILYLQGDLLNFTPWTPGCEMSSWEGTCSFTSVLYLLEQWGQIHFIVISRLGVCSKNDVVGGNTGPGGGKELPKTRRHRWKMTLDSLLSAKESSARQRRHPLRTVPSWGHTVCGCKSVAEA